MDFTHRSNKKELLDGNNIPFDAIKQNMKELDFINIHLGGHRITIEGIRKLIDVLPPPRFSRQYTICEIGCGGGDNLVAIQNWGKKEKLQFSFIGIDINPDCIKVATSRPEASGFRFISSDYRATVFGEKKPDIIFSSLFCHHFTNEELIAMMQWMKANATLGFFINDLHRHPLAFYSIKLLTQLFSKSYLVRNDAPLSVLRGFKKKNWKNLLESAGIHKYAIYWKWAFRYLVAVKKAE